jgi:hypothetical protein
MWGMYIGVCFMYVMGTLRRDKEHKEIVRNQEVIIDLLQERQVMDSITTEHVGNCLWLGKDHVEVGYDGYLRTTYIDGYASK